MKYVFDSDSLIDLFRHYYPERFPTLWENFDALVSGGKPVADPFVIARAKISGACVVTQEKKTDNAAKIPNVCDHFGIRCINLEGFMEKESWKF